MRSRRTGAGMRSAAFFIEKAAQCRLLASSAVDEHTAAVLMAMANEFEALAAECAASEAGEKTD
jgi:hypothetical protein